MRKQDFGDLAVVNQTVRAIRYNPSSNERKTTQLGYVTKRFFKENLVLVFLWL